MALLHEYLLVERKEIMEQNIRFTTIGRRSELPASVLREIDENIRLSEANTGMTLCLAINYGARTELVDAVRTLAQQVKAGQRQETWDVCQWLMLVRLREQLAPGRARSR